MTKQISFTGHGTRADIGAMEIHRILPNRYAEAVGPFVFLDHIGPMQHAPDAPRMREGTGAHPHRGIATLTYLLAGEGVHFDSRGHHATIRSGGIQWMKAGNGILHDETVNPDPASGSPVMHGFQFWINLPAAIKAEAPEYRSVQADAVPTQILDGNRGWLKVIAGVYGGLVSTIPSYTTQYLYHIHLNGGQEFRLDTEPGLEYAAFLPLHDARVSDTAVSAGEFIEFDRDGGTLVFSNPAETAIDILLFGGARYTEPIVAQGPFVMNSPQEIATAYTEFFTGRYGEIDYGVAEAQA